MRVGREIDLDDGTLVEVEAIVRYESDYGADADGNRGASVLLVADVIIVRAKTADRNEIVELTEAQADEAIAIATDRAIEWAQSDGTA